MDDKQARRLQMGMETLRGDRPQGFFTPYRYADQVRPPTPYPRLEQIFDAARPRIARVLDLIADQAEALWALAGPPPVPRWDQSWFPRLDGAAAYAIVADQRPARMIEVGSGHSTRMLAHAGEGADIICIDPEPRAALPPAVRHLPRVLSADDVGLFADLEASDIAFFDSSHILWPGTDVDIILNRIIPVLQPGVLIHIHDILLPDPYPDTWEWRGYTEQNGVAPLLLGACEIVFSSHYALTRMGAAKHPAIEALPLPPNALETSLWLRRI